jgi:hypothetical protein
VHHICFGVDDVEAELRTLDQSGLPIGPLGSGRGRPAGFVSGLPRHGVRLECTLFERPADGFRALS